MGRFHGAVGYACSVEKMTSDGRPTGVVIDTIRERQYTGDVTKRYIRTINSESINDGITTNTEISVVADSFAYQNFSRIKYVNYMGVNWKVTSVDVQAPRLILSIGGIWNGETAGSER